MVKYILTALAGIALIAAPLQARDRPERDKPRHEQREDRVKSHKQGSGGILGFIAGILVGTAVLDTAYHRPRYYGPYPHRSYSPVPPHEYPRPNVYPYNQFYCVTEQHVDHYGNIYYTRQCNY